MRRSPWSEAERLLCVRLDTIGDVLMTTPALRALKQCGRRPSLSLLTSRGGAEAASFVPEVDDVVVYDAPWMKATPTRSAGEPDVAMVDRLRRGRFDAAVIFTVYSQSPLPAALMCHLAGIPLRIAHCRENPYSLLTNWIPEPEPERLIRHEVQRQLDLVASIGAATTDRRLSFRVPHRARIAAAMLLTRGGVNTGAPWAVIHPGASAPSRRYNPRGFATAADSLVRDLGWQVVFTGSAGEVELVTEIQERMESPSLSLAGRLGLADLGAVIEAAPVLISNNTAPVHIAAALGTPVVDLYALTNPQHTPWEVAHRVLYHDVPCKFCYKSVCPEGHHNCLELVSPAAIVDAAADLAAPGRRGGAPGVLDMPAP